MDWDVSGACAELVGAALGNELAVNTLMNPNLAKLLNQSSGTHSQRVIKSG